MPEIFAHTPVGSYSPSVGNRLLDTLDNEHLEDLLSHSTTVSLDLAQIVHEPNKFFKYVYFPTDGVVSTLCIMEDGQTAEVSAIGCEGFVGSALTLGVDRTPGRSMVQVKGSAIRMDADQFTDAIARDKGLNDLIERYIQTLIVRSSQTIACNHLHPLRQRFAGFLLQISDCMHSDRFALTQEFMSQMLVVRRATVSTAASEMQKAGLITYSRGKITVLDRAGLEAASCECYQAVKQEYNRLLG